MTKTCSKCNTEKPLDEFHKQKRGLYGVKGRCRNCCNAYSLEYDKKNKDSKREYNKKYYQEDIVAQRERVRKYYKNNKESRSIYNKKWHKENRVWMSEYNRKKYRNDPNFRILTNMRNRLNHALNGELKQESAKKLLGCTVEYALIHLESQFVEGMTWGNHGYRGWHVDHIIPCASYDMTDPEQQRQCFHYTNLQPLWAEDNLRKSDKMPHEL